MTFLQLLEKIPDIYNLICPPDKTLILRGTSKKNKDIMDNLNLEVHIQIKMLNSDKFYALLKNISKNYIITKIEFMKNKSRTYLDLDIISETCPSLNYINMYDNCFCFSSLIKFEKNLPKCKVLSCCIDTYNHLYNKKNDLYIQITII